MSHDPKAKIFIQKMGRFEKTFKQFLASEDFEKCIIDYACHTNAWHYRNQTLKVELLPF
ncbi:MAG: hypothetical protein H0U76_22255 [Ktedonobacteraceae bacterium]|nr:hypothetical protein [Ktedonobacteraceae bacterium]